MDKDLERQRYVEGTSTMIWRGKGKGRDMDEDLERQRDKEGTLTKIWRGRGIEKGHGWIRIWRGRGTWK